MKIVIYPFPATDKNNPFMDSFYGEINQKNLEGFEFEVKQSSLAELVKKGTAGKEQKNIIHIHWSTQLYGSRFIIKSLYLMAVNFYRLFILKKKYYFKVIWTMHNYSSHDYPHPFIDWFGRKVLFSLANCIILQQESTQKVLANKHKDKRITFIPLGNYIGVYGKATKSQSEMRKVFGFDEDDLVVLSFGMLRPYKKNDEIIKVFQENQSIIDKRIKFLIAGPATDKYAGYIQSLVNRNEQIVFKNAFIENNEVANFFQLADYSIFWFDDSVLTSSGVILSLSYGVPVIARNIPAAEMVVDNKSGFLFNDKAGLLGILKKLSAMETLDKQDVVNSVAGATWPSIAGKFMTMCIGLWNRDILNHYE